MGIAEGEVSDQPKKPAPNRVADVLKELNDGMPPTPARTPEEHYAEAESRLALAERADAVIRERAELDMLPSHTIQTAFDRHYGLANLHRLMAETGLAFEKHIVMEDGEVDGVYDTDSEAIKRRDDLNVRSGAPDASVVSKYVSSPRGMQPAPVNPFTSMTAQPAPDHPSVPVELFKGVKPGETVTVSPAVAHQIIGQAFVGLNGHGLTMVRNVGEYNGKCVCGKWNNDGYARAQDVALNWAEHLDNYRYPDADNETVTMKALLCKGRSAKDGEYCQREKGHEGPHHFKVASD
jgi:hypothetical protein